MPSLAKKVAFVAGASGGINLAIAARLAAAGAQTVIVSRSASKIADAAESIRNSGGDALGLVADVRDYEQLAQAFEQTYRAFGPVDIVVSGAAGNFLAPAGKLSARGFRTVVDIDLIGTFNVLRASFDHLRKPGASLVSITAPQGARAYAFQAHACAAKAGVNMLTKVLALEWGKHGIRVNAISPGPIAGTEGVTRLWPDEESQVALKREIPLGTLGSLSSVPDAVLFLSSPASSFVTGTILDVDGGYVLSNSRLEFSE